MGKSVAFAIASRSQQLLAVGCGPYDTSGRIGAAPPLLFTGSAGARARIYFLSPGDSLMRFADPLGLCDLGAIEVKT